ncbi:stimulated by retinoic acid gene 6 protein-like [Crassostrea angulata]|uniref:stimulated by retinoic acid gene 6 protein-like n=1 Tax=Magallana angulata TaxID=2784310 RepID=UPI0022B1EF98|nr:stimulated by retinoic acid gene 6 protein-like [Crassostrea angulata]
MPTYSVNSTTAVPVSSAANDLCIQINKGVLWGLWVYAIVAILIISLFEKRRYKPEICFGRPGLPLPINFLDGTSNSIANAAAFGCTLQHIVSLLFFTEFKVDNWMYSLVLFLFSFIVALSFYPVFACLNSPSRVFGSLVGFLYTLLLTLMMFARSYYCTNKNWYWAIYAVTLISEIYIMILFTYRFFTAIFKKHNEVLVKIDQIQHVKELLVKPKSHTDTNDIRQKFVSYSETVLTEAKLCCLHKSLYRCTTRTLAINTIVLLVFFYNVIVTFAVGEEFVRFLTATLVSNISPKTNLYQHITVFLDVINVSLIIGNILSAVYLITNMVLIYRSQRDHLVKRWRGDKSFIPTQCKLNHSEILVKSLMYAGNQVSYLLGGYLLSQIVIVVFCIFLAYCVILPIIKKVPSVFLYPVEVFLPGVLFMFGLQFLLRFISGRIFLQNHFVSRQSGTDMEKVLALDNRRVYQNLSFFLFFYYILTGLYRCTYRVLTSMFISLFYIARMDKPLLVSGFEQFDIGYMTYLGFLEVELQHCHPVVVVSCDLMLKSANALSTKQETSLESPSSENNKRELSNMYTHRIRNKWQKMMTLVSNSNLCKYSKTNNSFEQQISLKVV